MYNSNEYDNIEINTDINLELDDTISDNKNEDKKTKYPTQVNFSKAQYSLFEIKRQIERSLIRRNDDLIQQNNIEEVTKDNLDETTKGVVPDYQRKAGIWDKSKKSLLIESILMGIPLPLFYFAANKEGGLSIVDGLQRLSTIIEFLNNKSSLSKVEYLNNLKNKKFNELSNNEQARIEDYQIHCYILEADTPEDVKLDIFKRINDGGTPLNKYEIRNALYSGRSTKLLKELSESQEFKNVLGANLNAQRMRDRYVIMRALAFYLWRNQHLLPQNLTIDKELRGTLDDFISRYMRIINILNQKSVDSIKQLFIYTMKKIYTLYEDNAFKRNDIKTNSFNMILFESIFFIVTSLKDVNINDKSLKENINNIINKDWFIFVLDNSLKGRKRINDLFCNLEAEIKRIKVENA